MVLFFEWKIFVFKLFIIIVLLIFFKIFLIVLLIGIGVSMSNICCNCIGFLFIFLIISGWVRLKI